MSRIRLDYDNVCSQAQKLQVAAERCDEVVRRLQSEMSQLPYYWEGDSADTFLMVIQKQISDIRSMRQRLETIADHIKKVADELMRKDRELAFTVGEEISDMISDSFTGLLR